MHVKARQSYRIADKIQKSYLFFYVSFLSLTLSLTTAKIFGKILKVGRSSKKKKAVAEEFNPERDFDCSMSPPLTVDVTAKAIGEKLRESAMLVNEEEVWC